MSSQRAKELLSKDWLHITLLNFGKFSTLLIEDSQKGYTTPTTVAVVWALWSVRISFWSQLCWWVFTEQKSCCLQIDRISPSLSLLSWDWERYPEAICKAHYSSSHLSTLVLQDLLLIWAALKSRQRKKQLVSTDWSYIRLLNFVMLSSLLMEKDSHKRYATLTTLEALWAIFSLRNFLWSELCWWALQEQSSCCLQIDRILRCLS